MIWPAMRWPSQPLLLSPPDGALKAREWLALAVGAVAMTLLVVVMDPGVFGSTDWVRMHALYKAYCQSSVAHGRLPLWNPYHWLGRPFLADIESAFFYPPEWLYLVLDLRVACALTCALHYFLLLYGMVKLARALGAGQVASVFVAFVFAASAPIVGCFTSGLVHYGQALCLAPSILYLGLRIQAGPRRRDVGLLALAIGLQVLCGHPQASWLTALALFLLVIGRRLERPWRASLRALALDFAVLALALGLGLALAAIALLPFVELASQGNRPEASLAFAALFSEPSFGWATLAVPTRAPGFSFQANAQLYAGVLPLVAGLAGLSLAKDRNVRALWLVAAVSALLAAGQSTPAFAAFFHLIPAVGWLRIHSRATVWVTLALVLSAGLFVSRARGTRASLGVALTAFAVGIAAAAFCLSWPGFGTEAATSATWRLLLAAAAGLLLALWTSTSPERATRSRWLALATVFLTAGDLTLAISDLKRDNRASDQTSFQANLRSALDAQGLLAPGKAPPRVFLPGPVENAGMTNGWSSAQGYSALALGRVWRHLHEVLGVKPPTDINTFPSPRLVEFGPFPYRSMSLVIGVEPRGHGVVYNPAPDPRAYVVTAARQVRDDREATRLMREGHDFHAVALVEEPLSLPPSTAAGTAVITRFEPERIAVTVESATPALLVVAEPWYPGWSALVNASPAPCVAANAWMRAVPVPAGKSEVILSFKSRYLGIGSVLSLLALCAIGLLIRSPARARRQAAG